ncbi:MAG TPA: diacylglycerol kinase [Candidatus Corynebacterium gallistercoris]|uniref:Diacylglycerol kinase n=1 Tax=Candidatus Corynebacterium gallistercoris TaxID=2838530 RepID=A0A9D1RYK6_9CORY|nr:diacylglycerol kinase [Candidatus Corynebacterium gallistercoris]
MTFEVGHADIGTVALLTNPAAGKGKASDAAVAAARHLNERGVNVVNLQGSSPEEASRLAGEAVADPRVDALVVCGGDGLINLALQSQAQSGLPLGIIPAGTGNDHAREYNIPLDPVKAADVVADGFWSTTDLGHMRAVAGVEEALAEGDAGEAGVASPTKEGRWFGTIACAGFDSLVSDRTNRITWPKGRNRYNLAIALEFLNFHSLPARIVLDPGTDEERELGENVTLCAMGNTRSYGGGMYICPDADHHDGLLDVTVLGRMNRAEVVWKFGKIFSGEIRGENGVEMYRARAVYVELRDRGGVGAGPGGAGVGAGAGRGVSAGGAPINGYADGELFAPTPMLVRVVPGAGKYIVPRP